MKKVGITGAIGSGKTTISKEFSKLGAYHLNADNEAKEFLIRNKPIKNQIINSFGNDILNKENNIDLFKLSKKAFSNKKNQLTLNSIIHPKVTSFIDNLFNIMRYKYKTKLFIIDAALIFESKLNEKLDLVIFVKSDFNTRITRALLRGNHSKKEIIRRETLQMNEVIKEKKSDFIIKNNDSLVSLNKQINKIYNQIIF
ncbi:MAG: dephospho-CoA kinase [Candidatus Marinimicrobia bacterium]|nr:dephospho-CoA kinase [Candidatus Neomarinimicrobiota bacterium]|tara:strand:- start:2175 stop:2771 length:597 start_codon:yes stop_codon:yes gene_type:complete